MSIEECEWLMELYYENGDLFGGFKNNLLQDCLFKFQRNSFFFWNVDGRWDIFGDSFWKKWKLRELGILFL